MIINIESVVIELVGVLAIHGVVPALELWILGLDARDVAIDGGETAIDLPLKQEIAHFVE